MQERFVYHQIMDADDPAAAAVAKIAAAIGKPACARMLYSLLDGHARTSTELALVAEVSSSTGSVHLAHLKEQHLVRVLAQGKHRYYRLENDEVAAALEALAVVAGSSGKPFTPNTPTALRTARTCYDHMAGSVAVALHDCLTARMWLVPQLPVSDAYEVTTQGVEALQRIGLDVKGAQAPRRRFAYACVDWSERRPHLGGSLGAALLEC